MVHHNNSIFNLNAHNIYECVCNTKVLFTQNTWGDVQHVWIHVLSSGNIYTIECVLIMLCLLTHRWTHCFSTIKHVSFQKKALYHSDSTTPSQGTPFIPLEGVWQTKICRRSIITNLERPPPTGDVWQIITILTILTTLTTLTILTTLAILTNILVLLTPPDNLSYIDHLDNPGHPDYLDALIILTILTIVTILIILTVLIFWLSWSSWHSWPSWLYWLAWPCWISWLYWTSWSSKPSCL